MSQRPPHLLDGEITIESLLHHSDGEKAAVRKTSLTLIRVGLSFQPIEDRLVVHLGWSRRLEPPIAVIIPIQPKPTKIKNNLGGLKSAASVLLEAAFVPLIFSRLRPEQERTCHPVRQGGGLVLN